MKSFAGFLLIFLTPASLTAQRFADKFVVAYNVAVKDSSGKSNYEVFMIGTDGSGEKNITRSKDVAWTYKSNKDKLFFVSDRDTCYRCYFLYKADTDGKNVKKVSPLQLEDSYMDFRRDGKELVVSGRKGKELRYQLFLIDTETGGYKQLTNDTAAVYLDPAFSPDGSRLVFSYRKYKRNRNQNEELYLMNEDGTGLRPLTDYPQKGNAENKNGYKAAAPHWHPSGDFISYISMINGIHNLYAVTPDGKKQWKLTENLFAEGWHDWTPDGRWLVFDASDKDGNQYDIMLMNWKTKAMKRLTGRQQKYQQAPSFVLK